MEAHVPWQVIEELSLTELADAWEGYVEYAKLRAAERKRQMEAANRGR